MNQPILYLLPNLLGDLEDHRTHLPSSIDSVVAVLDSLIAENEKEARRFLKRFAYPSPKTFRDIPIHLLNEHSTPADKKELFAAITQGGKWGLVSDCGMPCLADPGADIVLMAREKGIAVETFAGPSSILMALVLGGLGGQQFAFHGYLPKEERELLGRIRSLEKRSKEEQATQLFIETPYRNQKMLHSLLNTLDSRTWLSIACDLSLPTQQVWTYRVSQWKSRELPSIDKRPAVFSLLSK